MKTLSLKSQWDQLPSDGDPVIRERIWRKIRFRLGRRVRIAAVITAAAAFAGLFFGLRPHSFLPWAEPKIQTYSVTTPPGTKTRVALPDGTVIYVNAGSTLYYTSNFNVKDRDVTLDGEAYFEVEKNPRLAFRVITQNGVFSVLGTKFNVSSYAEDGIVLGALVEGSLQFEREGEARRIRPGEVLSFQKGTCTVKQTDVSQYCSWTGGRIKYDSISLRDLCRRLSRAYDMEIILTSDSLGDRTVRVSFTQDDSIATIMKTLGVILPIRVQRTGKTIYIHESSE